MTDTNDFLMGSGSKSAFGRDDAVGYTVTGKVQSVEVRQQTDLDGNLLTWDNGDPRMQLVVTLATDLRDDPEDDGVRAVYVKGSKAPGSKSVHDAVRAAVQKSGAKGLEVGGTLTVSFVGTEPSKTRGYSDRKLWEAQYAAPDKAAQSGDFLGTTPAPTTTPVQAAPPAPAPSGSDAGEKARQLVALGLDDATIAGATGLDASVIALLRTAA
ncbi:hypothetical protein GCM10025864_44860 [Luteimicrobium album]|uniref:Uncharacterized protein n=2 Tax=Luteimicrobium album TaxID=1054550 RepID=A0ABQ6HXG5_9MICO|nr:hypothetical protein [Luteimicrobium album]GMA22260.1 hypothetical protein GCM10025864_00190 [Luteimicrobium album]GMA26665.1 hypothetical protein GCM10025864_44240 [Luteimicrobium album]GMA26727.1 hypothetical protein GCM10025864_44860 [Luteimicrobium album]